MSLQRHSGSSAARGTRLGNNHSAGGRSSPSAVRVATTLPSGTGGFPSVRIPVMRALCRRALSLGRAVPTRRAFLAGTPRLHLSCEAGGGRRKNAPKKQRQGYRQRFRGVTVVCPARMQFGLDIALGRLADTALYSDECSFVLRPAYDSARPFDSTFQVVITSEPTNYSDVAKWQHFVGRFPQCPPPCPRMFTNSHNREPKSAPGV